MTPFLLVMGVIVGTIMMIILLSISAGLPSSEENFVKWAKRNRFQILERREVERKQTPFGAVSVGLPIPYLNDMPDLFFYDFTVKDAQGNVRRGWAKVRGVYDAGFSRSIEIKWRD